MSPDDQTRLLAQLGSEEGYRRSAYQDSLGFWTIGYGRLIDARKGAGLSHDEALYLLKNDVAEKLAELAPYAWYNIQDSVRQLALTDMCFNLGLTGLLHFPHFLGYMLNKDYASAVKELQNTPWHAQVGSRADRIIHQISTGSYA